MLRRDWNEVGSRCVDLLRVEQFRTGGSEIRLTLGPRNSARIGTKKPRRTGGPAGASGSVYGGTYDGEGKPIARNFTPPFPKSGVTPITH